MRACPKCMAGTADWMKRRSTGGVRTRRRATSPTTLSPFLTGITDHPDPIRALVDPNLTFDFDDLRRREIAMDAILAMTCPPYQQGYPQALPGAVQQVKDGIGTRVH